MPRIAFFSTMESSPWGGSEELWSRTALVLAAEGIPVSASVASWPRPRQQVEELKARGVDVSPRPKRRSLPAEVWRRLLSPDLDRIVLELDRFLATRRPALIVFSDGVALPQVALLERCIARGVPFATIGNGISDGWWQGDELSERFRKATTFAAKCYFVAHAQRRQAEMQIGGEIPNAEVIRNSFNVRYEPGLPWPALGPKGELYFANVASLHPQWKGQDILLRVLAGEEWRPRPWHARFYGDGPSRGVLQRLADRLGLADRVTFAGYARVEDIWAANHVLVMPSRVEGLPAAMVEAMLCARPVIATDIAGHAEIVADGVTGFLADAPTPPAFAAAMARFWLRRDEAERIGLAGSAHIRRLVPPDPVRIFAGKLKALLGLDVTA